MALQIMPVSRLRVEWTLTADHDLATVPETGRAAQPQGRASIPSLNFLPDCLLPVFNRALWHDEQGRFQRADVSVAADRTFLNGRPGGPGWCALYHTGTKLLFGLVPERWGDGGIVHLAAYDSLGYPKSALQMRLVGVPASNWKAGESHTWSYWLVAARAETETAAVAVMDAACAARQGGPKVTVEPR
jgi:hypothetical protein